MKDIYKAIAAGFSIGLGGIAYAMVDNKMFGAFIFSFGLLCVLLRKYKLFTGWVAWAGKKDIKDGITMLCFNLAGACFAGLLCRGWVKPLDTMVIAKLSQPFIQTLFRAIGCGVCMYLAVSGFRENFSVYSVFMGVMLFIVAGFEHCIADMFYFAASGAISIQIIPFMVATILGNIIGAQMMRRITE